MCRVMTYRSAGAEASGRFAAIDILLLWSKELPFRYDVGFHVCPTEPTFIGVFYFSTHVNYSSSGNKALSKYGSIAPGIELLSVRRPIIV